MIPKETEVYGIFEVQGYWEDLICLVATEQLAERIIEYLDEAFPSTYYYIKLPIYYVYKDAKEFIDELGIEGSESPTIVRFSKGKGKYSEKDMKKVLKE